MPQRPRWLIWLRRTGLAGSVLVVLFLALLVSVFGATPVQHRGAESDHFDGTRFFNPEASATDRQTRGFLRGLRWFLFGERTPWPQWIGGGPPGPRPAERVGDDVLRVIWVNHSTFLIQTAGLNLLTDPVWADRVSPVSWAGPQRVRMPGLRFEDLPGIDVVLISHDHYDHLDLETLAQLVARDQPRIFYGLGVGQQLNEELAERGEALDWWQQRTLDKAGKLRLTFTPARHFSGRGLFDRNHTLWGSYVLETPRGPLYFAGDTGYGGHFRAIRERFGPMRLALLPIGAYQPENFMAPVHVSPEQAVQASEDLQAEDSLAMHFSTFPLAAEGIHIPEQALQAALAARAAAGKPRRFALPEAGKARDF